MKALLQRLLASGVVRGLALVVSFVAVVAIVGYGFFGNGVIR